MNTKWSVPGEIHVPPTVYPRIPKWTMAIAAVLLVSWMLLGCALFTLVL